MELFTLLHHSQAAGASDLHLASGTLPYWRLHGALCPIPDHPKVEDTELKTAILAFLTEQQQLDLSSQQEIDFAQTISPTLRCRWHIFQQHHGLSVVLRLLPQQRPTLSAADYPQSLQNLAQLTQGLVLICGATGSGKTTTLAAVIDHINHTRPCHIVTLEDPIEFIHSPQKALIQQREIGRHTLSFSQALTAALREDPDVLMIGELRDLASIRLALTAAETGHLVLGTLHSNSAIGSLNRLIDGFPGDEKAWIRTQLSGTLQAVIAQRLVPAKTGGRVANVEVLRCTDAVKNLIREQKNTQITSLMQTGSAHGMQTLDQHLQTLIAAGKVAARVV